MECNSNNLFFKLFQHGVIQMCLELYFILQRANLSPCTVTHDLVMPFGRLGGLVDSSIILCKHFPQSQEDCRRVRRTNNSKYLVHGCRVSNRCCLCKTYFPFFIIIQRMPMTCFFLEICINLPMEINGNFRCL